MKSLIRLWCLGTSVFLFFVHPSFAQTASADPTRQFYLFVSRGRVSGIEVGPNVPVPAYPAWHFGGTVEWFKFKGLAVGAELAATARERKGPPVSYTYLSSSGVEKTNTVRARGVDSWGSLNLAYHFKGPLTKGRLSPFVTAGGTILARAGGIEVGNYGGGLSLWATRHSGVRLEYRKYVLREPFPQPRFRSLRFGLVLR